MADYDQMLENMRRHKQESQAGTDWLYDQICDSIRATSGDLRMYSLNFSSQREACDLVKARIEKDFPNQLSKIIVETAEYPKFIASKDDTIADFQLGKSDYRVRVVRSKSSIKLFVYGFPADQQPWN